MTALGFRCCTWALSICGEWGLFFSCGAWTSHCSGFSFCRAWALRCADSAVVAQALSCLLACVILLKQGSNPYSLHWNVKVKLLVTHSCQLFVMLWTVVCQAPLSLEFSRQEYWSWLPFPSPGDLPNPGIKPGSPGLQAESLPSEPSEKPSLYWQAES